MDAFPAYVPLARARIVVAGEGAAAEAKARLFATSPAELVRLSGAEATEREAYAGARLAFVAGEGAWLEAAVAAARAAGAWVNAVDRPDLCDFTTPAVIDRGRVVGAVGTTGSAPVLAVHLRQEIEARWPARLDGLAALLAAMRAELTRRTMSWSARRRALAALLRGPWAQAALGGNAAEAQALALAALDEGRLAAHAPGLTVVRLPARPDLLTLREVRAINQADVLLHSAQTPAEVLIHARRDARLELWRGEPQELDGRLEGSEAVVAVGDFEAWADLIPPRAHQLSVP